MAREMTRWLSDKAIFLFRQTVWTPPFFPLNTESVCILLWLLQNCCEKNREIKIKAEKQTGWWIDRPDTQTERLRETDTERERDPTGVFLSQVSTDAANSVELNVACGSKHDHLPLTLHYTTYYKHTNRLAYVTRQKHPPPTKHHNFKTFLLGMLFKYLLNIPTEVLNVLHFRYTLFLDFRINIIKSSKLVSSARCTFYKWEKCW